MLSNNYDKQLSKIHANCKNDTYLYTKSNLAYTQPKHKKNDR